MDYINRLFNRNSPSTSGFSSPEPESGNEASSNKPDQQQQHDVKVRFIREFADASGITVRDGIPESSSLSSASSFQSLASTLSSKCSSGICVDSSPNKNADTSYVNTDISGLDDLITACENIRLDGTIKEESFDVRAESEATGSPNETFTSAEDGINENSPIILTNEPDHNLNVTRELTRENSPINFSNESDFNENPTSEITNENSSFNFSNETLSHLNITTDINGKDLTINRSNPINLDLNLTKDIAIVKNPEINHPNELIIDPNVTKDKSSEDLKANCTEDENFDLDITREISNDNFSINSSNLINYELDKTKEVTSDLSSINLQSDEKETIFTFDGETKTPLANTDFEAETLDSEQTDRCSLYDLKKSEETFIKYSNDIVELKESSESVNISKNVNNEPEVEKTHDSSTILELKNNKNEEKLEKYEENPLKSIVPSHSQFHHCSLNIDENIKKIEKSPEKTLSNLKLEEFKELKEINEIVDTSKSLINELTKTSQLPSLSALSSIDHQISNLSENFSVPNDNEQIQETPLPIQFTSEKFSSDEFIPDNSISNIQEPNFFDTQNFTDDDNPILNVETRKNEVSSSIEIKKPEEIVQLRALEINNDSAKELIQEELRNIEREIEKSCLASNFEISTKNEESPIVKEKIDEKEKSINARSEIINVEIKKENFSEVNVKRDISNDNLDSTVNIADLSTGDILENPESYQYTKFIPQKHSTSIISQQQLKSEKLNVVEAIKEEHFISRPISLNDDFSSNRSFKLEKQNTHFLTALPIPEESLINDGSSKTSPNKKIESIEDRCNFAKLELAANSVANDILITSFELPEENEHYVSAESELFQDPTNFDFLLTRTPKKNTRRDLRELSLYVKFDPLVSSTSMLPQGNIQHASPPANEARNGDNNTTIANIGTPKRNPALAAIDRLLFYSPMSANTTPTNTNTTIQKTNDVQEKMKPTEETSEATINMAKELELVRTTVLQLEEQLEKLIIDHDETLEKQESYKEKINQLQAQLAQEIKNKNEITVVVDEYEISISRLVAERERDRKNLDLEKAKLQEELAAAKHHLDNTEAAFNDVHLKYERLKAVVATYKSNEAALKESLQENVEIIKSLENRYEQVKSHATARLEKANQELDEIRKQNESETVRLHAMLRKAELKSNSLAELVEQKTNENKALTQILDEFIARVGRNKTE